MMGGNVRVGWVIVLALMAAISSWWLWSLQQDDDEPALTGPPRSDYSLQDYELISLDVDGKESFAVRGPRLSRHPFLGTLNLELPKFEFPGKDGGRWNAESGYAWIAADGKQVRLYRSYTIDGPQDDNGRMHMNGPDITVYPDTNVAETEHDVTIRDGRSILHGHGMRAELDDRHVTLSQLKGRFQAIR